MILVRIIPLIVLIVGIYFIVTYAMKAWNRADIDDKKTNLNELDRAHQKVVEFNKEQDGVSPKKQRKQVDKFLNK